MLPVQINMMNYELMKMFSLLLPLPVLSQLSFFSRNKDPQLKETWLSKLS